MSEPEKPDPQSELVLRRIREANFDNPHMEPIPTEWSARYFWQGIALGTTVLLLAMACVFGIVITALGARPLYSSSTANYFGLSAIAACLLALATLFYMSMYKYRRATREENKSRDHGEPSR